MTMGLGDELAGISIEAPVTGQVMSTSTGTLAAHIWTEINPNVSMVWTEIAA